MSSYQIYTEKSLITRAALEHKESLC